MFALIGNIVKYSAIILGVLVGSHIIQIHGVTISQHVENSMNWVGGGFQRDVTRVSQQLSSSVSTVFRDRNGQVERVPDSDITAADRKELNRIILRTQKK
jgi:hypothetical protein